jgi:hypothetical protein
MTARGNGDMTHFVRRHDIEPKGNQPNASLAIFRKTFFYCFAQWIVIMLSYVVQSVTLICVIMPSGIIFNFIEKSVLIPAVILFLVFC